MIIAVLVLAPLTLAAIVLSPEYAPKIRRWRSPLARRVIPVPEYPVFGRSRSLDTPPDTHAVRHDGVITAQGGSVTVTPGRHAASLPRRQAERQPGTEWTGAQPAVRP